MSVLVVGLSHKSAPVSVLERAAVSGDTLGKLLHDIAHLPDIAETFVISTCNRVEVYAAVDGAVSPVTRAVAALIAARGRVPAADVLRLARIHVDGAAAPGSPDRQILALIHPRAESTYRTDLR